MGNQQELKHRLALLQPLSMSALARLRLAKPKLKMRRNVER
jgi:hypothetical protein